MTAKEYLAQLRKLQRNISILHEEIERYRARLESTSAPLKPDKVQSSIKGDRFADAIAELADADLQRQELCLIYEALRDRIVKQILDVPVELWEAILYQYYVKGLSLWKIAEMEHYSYSYVRQEHRSALMFFELQYGPF
jgi:hypothetical protein